MKNDIATCSPPPLLNLARVLIWVNTAAPAIYTGNMLVFEGDERLGQVSNLAICQHFGDNEKVLFHCNEAWDVIGCSGFGTIAELKAQAEIVYRNINKSWQELAIGKEDAESFLETLFEEEICLFCSKRLDQVGQMFSSGEGMICNDCVSKFHHQYCPDSPKDISEKEESL